MIRTYIVPLFLVVIFGCIEPYEFKIVNNDPTIVIEGFISDKSYNDTRSYPSDGRYFTVKITSTGDVTNRRPEVVSFAFVQLVSSSDAYWTYTETEPGTYTLLDDSFRAVTGEQYKLIVQVGEDFYETDFVQLPQRPAPQMNDITFRETQRQTYVVEAGETVIRSKQGIEALVDVPKHSDGPVYYRWDYTPIWIYDAPLISSSSPVKRCWVRTADYLSDYTLQLDNTGGYKKDLFFIETVRNERLFEMFSVLVAQYEMNEENFFFWKEMQDQANRGNVSDTPPYNLKTNFYNINGKRVSGYFDVVREQAKRWYFNKNELSYPVTNTLKGDCLVVYGPGGPAPECLDCLEYSRGTATNARPVWWTD